MVLDIADELCRIYFGKKIKFAFFGEHFTLKSILLDHYEALARVVDDQRELIIALAYS